MLINENVKFLLLKKQTDRVSCIVYFKVRRILRYVYANNTCIIIKSYVFQGKNVAEELLKIGFATVDSIDFALENDKLYLKYYKSLLKLENKAEKGRLGVWSNTTQTFMDRAMGKVGEALLNFFYKFRRWSMLPLL